MLISHVATSAGSIGFLRFGPAASTTPQVRATTMTALARSSLGVDMLHLAFRVDRPCGDAVVVLAAEGGHRQNAFALAALGDDLRARRLRVACFIPGAALQHRSSAVP